MLFRSDKLLPMELAIRYNNLEVLKQFHEDKTALPLRDKIVLPYLRMHQNVELIRFCSTHHLLSDTDALLKLERSISSNTKVKVPSSTSVQQDLLRMLAYMAAWPWMSTAWTVGCSLFAVYFRSNVFWWSTILANVLLGKVCGVGYVFFSLGFGSAAEVLYRYCLENQNNEKKRQLTTHLSDALQQFIANNLDLKNDDEKTIFKVELRSGGDIRIICPSQPQRVLEVEYSVRFLNKKLQDYLSAKLKLPFSARVNEIILKPAALMEGSITLFMELLDPVSHVLSSEKMLEKLKQRFVSHPGLKAYLDFKPKVLVTVHSAPVDEKALKQSALIKEKIEQAQQCCQLLNRLTGPLVHTNKKAHSWQYDEIGRAHV